MKTIGTKQITMYTLIERINQNEVARTNQINHFLFFKSIISTNPQVNHPRAPNVTVSFKIPEPQKTTEGKKSIPMANHFTFLGYFFATAENIAHKPLKLKVAKNKAVAE